MKSIPQQLLDSIADVKGYDALTFKAAHEQPSVTSIRLHPRRKHSDVEGLENVPWCENSYYLIDRPVFTLDPSFHAGVYYVQEASSMFLQHALRSLIPEKKGLKVLDLCAAPGGKSTLIASFLDGEGLLVSNEVIRSRASILEENMTRWGYANTWVSSNDPKSFSNLKGFFDVIVVDAPCSGSGLFRKDAAAIEEWSTQNVQLCSERQERILADVWPALKEGGVLIYATCSYSKQENEETIDRLSESFELDALAIPLKEEWGIVATRSEKGNIGYRFFPHRVNGEGFFLAAVRKTESVGEVKPIKWRAGPQKKIWEQCSYLLKEDSWSCLSSDKEGFFAIPSRLEEELYVLSKALYLRKVGVHLGMPGKKEWIPSHEVALSLDAADNLPKMEVEEDQALLFLKKENFMQEAPPKGWYIVTYNDMALGWIKSLGNRINNNLPKHWRIRMDISVSN